MSTLLSLLSVLPPRECYLMLVRGGFFVTGFWDGQGKKIKRWRDLVFFSHLLGHKQVRTNGMAVVCCGVLVIEFWKLGIEGIRFGAFFHTRSPAPASYFKSGGKRCTARARECLWSRSWARHWLKRSHGGGKPRVIWFVDLDLLDRCGNGRLGSPLKSVCMPKFWLICLSLFIES